jgi:hypothetical protein
MTAEPPAFLQILKHLDVIYMTIEIVIYGSQSHKKKSNGEKNLNQILYVNLSLFQNNEITLSF